jgi:uncharacterized protein YeeX (DUF496 family)
MNKIGLISMDGLNFPNLALMKISAYHKSIRDRVEWITLSNYDQTYISKVFSFTREHLSKLINYGKIIRGGTGYNMNILPDYIDKMYPDYSIYPEFKESYGFLTRGCPNKCSWCIVPKKEGNIKPYMDIEEIIRDKKGNVILMDNNVLASEWGLSQIEKIVKLGLKIDFNQGLDAKIICSNIEIVKLLSKVKWHPCLRMACDTTTMKEPVRKATELLRKYKCTPKNYFIYVLLNDLQNSYDRINFCKDLELDAYSQPFRDFTPNQVIPQWQNDMLRYTAHKAIYKSIDFKDYVPRKWFKCSKYFELINED